MQVSFTKSTFHNIPLRVIHIEHTSWEKGHTEAMGNSKEQIAESSVDDRCLLCRHKFLTLRVCAIPGHGMICPQFQNYFMPQYTTIWRENIGILQIPESFFISRRREFRSSKALKCFT